jgi:hypothetical protein
MDKLRASKHTFRQRLRPKRATRSPLKTPEIPDKPTRLQKIGPHASEKPD